MSPLRRSNRPSRRGRQRSRGQALVEFALVIPIFLLILSGIFDFGSLLFARMTVINASREGARAAAIVPDPTAAKIQNAAQGSASAAASGMAVTVTTSCVPGSAGTCTWDNTKGESVKVTVSYTYNTFFPLLFGTTIPLGSSTQMVLE